MLGRWRSVLGPFYRLAQLDGLSMISSGHCCLKLPNSPPNSPVPPPSPPAPPLLASFSIHILKNSLSFISSILVITVFNCASCLLKLSSVGRELICRLALISFFPNLQLLRKRGRDLRDILSPHPWHQVHQLRPQQSPRHPALRLHHFPVHP